MKNKNSIEIVSIKSNDDIVKVLHHGKKIVLKNAVVWLIKSKNFNSLKYALLVNKSNFKLAVTRNRIKRILRKILFEITSFGGLAILIKPNVSFISFSYNENKQFILDIFNEYHK